MEIFENIFGDSNISNNTLSGFATGIVKEIYDEKYPGMIKAEIYMTDGTVNVTDWMRVIVPYAGAKKGMYFLPDVGDEVAIIFERGDIERPYVIGCLWNQVDTIPENTVTKENAIKKIRTKGGHEIIFDDTEDKGKIDIITPKKSKISMEDENNCITITAKSDDGENIIKIDSKAGNITLNAKKKIILDAEGTKITIDGNGKKIEVEADNIDLKGKTINIKGQSVTIEGSKTDIKASGTMNIKCDGPANIKGAMVKIN